MAHFAPGIAATKNSAQHCRLMLLDGGVKRVLQLRALEFQFVNLLVGGVLDVLLDATDFVVQFVILLIGRAKMTVRQLERAYGFTMRRKLFYERVMQIHGKSSK